MLQVDALTLIDAVLIAAGVLLFYTLALALITGAHKLSERDSHHDVN